MAASEKVDGLVSAASSPLPSIIAFLKAEHQGSKMTLFQCPDLSLWAHHIPGILIEQGIQPSFAAPEQTEPGIRPEPQVPIFLIETAILPSFPYVPIIYA